MNWDGPEGNCGGPTDFLYRPGKNKKLFGARAKTKKSRAGGPIVAPEIGKQGGGGGGDGFGRLVK